MKQSGLGASLHPSEGNSSSVPSLLRPRALGLSAAGQSLLELKLQQRMIKAKLQEIDHKQDDLSRVIFKKMHDKSSSLYMGGPPLDVSIRVDGEHSIRDYRYFTKQNKALAPLPNPPRLSTDSDIPMVRTMGFGPKIDNIQLRHKMRTDGQREVNRRAKEKQDRERARERSKKGGHAKRSVPPSMFPDRYLRGELPCSIEHGVSGQYLSWVCPLENLDYDYYLPLFFDGELPEY
jgi:general stress protein YciG